MLFLTIKNCLFFFFLGWMSFITKMTWFVSKNSEARGEIAEALILLFLFMN